MSRIDAYLPPQDELSAGTRRQDAANQRDNWLRQMELAQMAQMGASPGPSAPAALTPARLPRAPLHAPLHAAESRARTAPHRAAEDAEGDEAVSPAGAQPAAGRAPQHAEEDDTQPAGGAEAAMTPGAQAAAAMPSAPVAPAASERDAAGLPAMAAAALPATVPGAALPVGARSSLAEGFTTVQAAPPGAAPALRAHMFPPAAAGAAETAETPEAGDASAAGADAAGEAPDWQKRMMHLTGDGDEVKLWIRDGELSPSQSQQLVARLAADVAGMGLRLKEATVNGKPALRAADRNSRPDAETKDGSDHPEPITHPTMER